MKMTERQFREYEENFNGVCLACGAEHFGGVDGDAENYKCEYCGKRKLAGMHTLLFSGQIEVIS